MFENIGKKIKDLVKFIFIVETILFVIAGIVFISYDLPGGGILCIIVGPLLAWISSWMLYGYGELIDKVCDIERNMHGVNGKSGQNMPQTNKATNIETYNIEKCTFCRKENADGAWCKINDRLGSRYGNLCRECIERNRQYVSILPKP